ncbi:hypothetical protein [Roseimicrobium sp. ORNL1]|uniref:hypothetical protein n=1 Tax=Roseimicrobium sp. ORNL1 TaxID=2711231 RepID=UPI001981A499|nr:hypothetical protein [Roseimicrobium sp. ORNL1]
MGQAPREVRRDGARVYASPMLDGRTRITVLRSDGSEETFKAMHVDPNDATHQKLAAFFSTSTNQKPPVSRSPRKSGGIFTALLGALLPGSAALHTVLREFDSIGAEITDRDAFARLSAATRPLLRRDKSNIAQALKSGVSPAHAALTALVTTAEDQLKSGSLSVQRGELSQEGESLLRLAKSLVWRMVSLGAISSAEAAKRIHEIRERVKEAG